MNLQWKTLKSDSLISWEDRGLSQLAFLVYNKPNQHLKYLNSSSIHKKTVFHAIPRGVFHRLANLTSFNNLNKDKTVDELYSIHAKALRTVGLVCDEFPVLSQYLKNDKMEEDTINHYDNDLINKKKDLRSAYLSICFCQCWNKRYIPLLLKRLKIKYNLPWIRVRISWKHFENVEELLGAALHKVVMKGLTSSDMKCRECNCSKPNKLEDGKCLYKGKCRESCVIYKVNCNHCAKFYIGNTQNFLKKRIQEHINDVVKLINKGIYSNSFAKHFASHFKSHDIISARHVKPLLHITTINRLNPLEASHNFGTDKCQLCMEERIEITSAWLKDGQKKLINKNTEIYGACRHKAKLHVYEKATPIGTDEGIESQKKKLDDSMNVISDDENDSS